MNVFFFFFFFGGGGGVLKRQLSQHVHLRVCIQIFLDQNLCCESQSDSFFQHPKHMLKWIDMKILKVLLISTDVFV